MATKRRSPAGKKLTLPDAQSETVPTKRSRRQLNSSRGSGSPPYFSSPNLARRHTRSQDPNPAAKGADDMVHGNHNPPQTPCPDKTDPSRANESGAAKPTPSSPPVPLLKVTWSVKEFARVKKRESFLTTSLDGRVGVGRISKWAGVAGHVSKLYSYTRISKNQVRLYSSNPALSINKSTPRCWWSTMINSELPNSLTSHYHTTGEATTTTPPS